MHRITIKYTDEYLDAGYPPVIRARSQDLGYDLRSMVTVDLYPGCVVQIDSGVHMVLPEGVGGILYVRSSLGTQGVILTTQVIDPGYKGIIMLTMINLWDVPVKIRAGDRVAQLVTFVAPATQLEVVEDLENVLTDRGANGFGSTGRF
jgi:dUTP pyrophosphatase